LFPFATVGHGLFLRTTDGMTEGEFERHVNPSGGKQPYYIRVSDQDVRGIAGLWSRSSMDANTVTECCSSNGFLMQVPSC
jgi:hypothetical protein